MKHLDEIGPSTIAVAYCSIGTTTAAIAVGVLNQGRSLAGRDGRSHILVRGAETLGSPSLLLRGMS